jgi:hypothetical protein
VPNAVVGPDEIFDDASGPTIAKRRGAEQQVEVWTAQRRWWEQPSALLSKNTSLEMM